MGRLRDLMSLLCENSQNSAFQRTTIKYLANPIEEFRLTEKKFRNTKKCVTIKKGKEFFLYSHADREASRKRELKDLIKTQVLIYSSAERVVRKEWKNFYGNVHDEMLKIDMRNVNTNFFLFAKAIMSDSTRVRVCGVFASVVTWWKLARKFYGNIIKSAQRIIIWDHH